MYQIDTYKVAQNIKIFRQMRQLSQRRLAEKLGKTTNTIANWEKGVSVPDCAVIEEICRALDVTPNELYGWDECKAYVDYLIELEHAQAFVEKATQKRSELDSAVQHYVDKFGSLLTKNNKID